MLVLQIVHADPLVLVLDPVVDQNTASKMGEKDLTFSLYTLWRRYCCDRLYYVPMFFVLMQAVCKGSVRIVKRCLKKFETSVYAFHYNW